MTICGRHSHSLVIGTESLHPSCIVMACKGFALYCFINLELVLINLSMFSFECVPYLNLFSSCAKQLFFSVKSASEIV